MALGLLLATLLAMALASTRADAALTSGTAFAWGYNYDGQLGNDTNGDGTETNIPGAVRNLSGVKSVKAGCDHSFALKNDGTVRAWGDNDYGQLGNGTDAPRNTPGAVNNLTNVKAMATDSSARHTLALLGDGTVKTWGYNDHGQLGDGTSLPGTYRAKPARIANLTGVRAVATGGFHSLALLTSGRVKSWGNNNQGELGNGNHGDSADRSTPVTVIGLDNVRSVSAGKNHSLAILESGRARSWGANTYGQLGNGASGPAADSDVPVGVKNLTGVKNIDGGYIHTLATAQ